MTACGVKPGVLTPFFDPTIGLLYIAAKGEGISVYEYTDAKTLQMVSEVKTDKPQTAIALLPKYQCDLENCEVARFLKLSNDNYIQTVSIRVPRKTKASLFQEDLYPPTPGTEPGLSMENWGKGRRASPKLVDLKPAGGLHSTLTFLARFSTPSNHFSLKSRLGVRCAPRGRGNCTARQAGAARGEKEGGSEGVSLL